MSIEFERLFNAIADRAVYRNRIAQAFGDHMDVALALIRKPLTYPDLVRMKHISYSAAYQLGLRLARAGLIECRKIKYHGHRSPRTVLVLKKSLKERESQ